VLPFGLFRLILRLLSRNPHQILLECSPIFECSPVFVGADGAGEFLDAADLVFFNEVIANFLLRVFRGPPLPSREMLAPPPPRSRARSPCFGSSARDRRMVVRKGFTWSGRRIAAVAERNRVARAGDPDRRQAAWRCSGRRDHRASRPRVRTPPARLLRRFASAASAKVSCLASGICSIFVRNP